MKLLYFVQLSLVKELLLFSALVNFPNTVIINFTIRGRQRSIVGIIIDKSLKEKVV